MVRRKRPSAREEDADEARGAGSCVKASVLTGHSAGEATAKSENRVVDSDESGVSDREAESGSTGSGHSSDTDSAKVDEDQRALSIKKELSALSFEELQELQSKVGLKAYNKMAYGPRNGARGEKRKRTHRNRPMEMSTRQPVPFLRKVIPVKKRMVRDPRFDDLSGEYKPEIFDQTYAFLSEVKSEEKEIIKKKLKKVKNRKTKQQLEYLLQRMNHQDEAQKNKQRERERLKEFKRMQRERVQQGSKPHFLKKSEQRKLELAEKFQELKRSGKLESFLGKKRKRNATKDRRKMPGKKPF